MNDDTDSTSSDEEDIMAMMTLTLLYKMLKERRKRRRQYLGWRRRRWWTRPLIVQMQSTGGEYENVFQQLMKEHDEVKFFKYTRMTYDQWNTLLGLVTPLLEKKHPRGFSPQRDLVITLRYFVTGNHFCDLAISFGCGESTVASVVQRTCSAIIQVLKPSQLRYPTENDFYTIMETFWKERQMPNCCGAMDGKHVTIIAPPHSGSMYFNYKSRFSVVLLGICDANYRFIAVDIGQYGSVSDGGVFSDSPMGKLITEEKANLPAHNLTLPNSEISIPAFFVADQAFPLSFRIMRPFPGKKLSRDQLVFNYRLSRARGLIENTFGILTMRWKIFRTPICVRDPGDIDNIVLSIVCLHNYLQKANNEMSECRRLYCPKSVVDHINKGKLVPGRWRAKNSGFEPIAAEKPKKTTVEVYRHRLLLQNFFMSDDSCPYQFDYIERGMHSSLQ